MSDIDNSYDDNYEGGPTKMGAVSKEEFGFNLTNLEPIAGDDEKDVCERCFSKDFVVVNASKACILCGLETKKHAIGAQLEFEAVKKQNLVKVSQVQNKL